MGNKQLNSESQDVAIFNKDLVHCFKISHD